MTRTSRQAADPARPTARRPARRHKKSQEHLLAVPPESEWTLAGKPIPEAVRHLVPFANTDQGIEVRNRRETARAASGVRLGDEPFDRIADAGPEVEDAPNPLVDNLAGHIPPGMQARWLGNARCDLAGMRGWETVKDPKTGEPVKCGRMFLGVMPVEKAARRRQANLAAAAANLKEAHENLQEGQKRAARDTGMVLKRGEVLRSSRTTVLGEDGEIETLYDDGRTASIGLRSRRGSAELIQRS